MCKRKLDLLKAEFNKNPYGTSGQACSFFCIKKIYYTYNKEREKRGLKKGNKKNKKILKKHIKTVDRGYIGVVI